MAEIFSWYDSRKVVKEMEETKKRMIALRGWNAFYASHTLFTAERFSFSHAKTLCKLAGRVS